MISGSNVNNIPQGANIPYGAVKDVMPNNINDKLPENLQNLDAKEIANSNGAVAAAGSIDKKSALLTIPIYGSFIGLKEFYSKKGFVGEYGKTVPGRIARFGDIVSKGISKIIPDTIESGLKTKTAAAKNWIVEHSAIARSMTTPLKLENSMAKREANGIFSRAMFDASEAFEKGCFGEVGGKVYKDLGVKELGEIFGTNTEFWKHLKDLGIENAKTNEGARKIVASALNNLGEQSLKDPQNEKYIKEIIQNLGNSKEVVIRNKIGNFSLGKLKIFDTNISMSELSNKIRAASKLNPDGATIAKSGLGKALAKNFLVTNEGLTSCSIGTKLAPIMQAYFLAKALIAASKAPKGKKVATFMDEEASMVTFLLTMPLATSILKHVGGTKYIGTDKIINNAASNRAAQSAGVDAYREAVANLNKKVNFNNNTISRGEYVKEVKRIKNMLKGKVGGGKSAVRFWQKPFKAIGRILGSNYNGETIKPFIEDAPENAGKLKTLGIGVSNKIQEFAYKVKSGNNKLGNTPGGIFRFLLVMFALSPLLAKPIKWGVNKIFGKPYDPEAEKKEAAKKAKKEMKKNKKNAVQDDPFKNLSQEDVLKLIQKNQNRIIEAQNNPQLLQELSSDPKKLYDFLQEGAGEYDKAQQNARPSEMLQKYKNSIQNNTNPQAPMPSNNIAQSNVQPNNGTTPQPLNNNMNMTMPAPSIQPQQPLNSQNTQTSQQQTQIQRSYIPSSKPADAVLNAQNIQDQKFNSIIADMDNTEKEFEKYLH